MARSKIWVVSKSRIERDEDRARRRRRRNRLAVWQDLVRYGWCRSPLLLGTQLPFEQVQPNVHHADAADSPKPLHDAVWWTEKTKDFDFTDADRNDPALFNRVLWEGTMASKPYPTARSGLDLRRDRDVLLKSAGVIE